MLRSTDIVSLDQLAREPQLVEALSDGQRREVLTRCGALVLLASNAEQAETPKPAPSEDPLLTVPAVAVRLGLARSYVYELTRTRQLPAVRVGRHVRIKSSELERFIATHDSVKGLDNLLSQRLDEAAKPKV